MIQTAPEVVEHPVDDENIVHWGCEYAQVTGFKRSMCGEDCSNHPMVDNNDPSLDCAMCVWEARRMERTGFCPLSGRRCMCRIVDGRIA